MSDEAVFGSAPATPDARVVGKGSRELTRAIRVLAQIAAAEFAEQDRAILCLHSGQALVVVAVGDKAGALSWAMADEGIAAVDVDPHPLPPRRAVEPKASGAKEGETEAKKTAGEGGWSG